MLERRLEKIDPNVFSWAGWWSRPLPELLALHGVGIVTAAAQLVAAGDNPERLLSEAAWAHLCGAAALEASPGKVVRPWLNRGGDRQANAALWRIAMVRMRSDPRTRDYVERRVDHPAAGHATTSPGRLPSKPGNLTVLRPLTIAGSAFGRGPCLMSVPERYPSG